MKTCNVQAVKTPEDISETLKALKQICPHLFIIDEESLIKSYSRYGQLETKDIGESFFIRLRNGDISEGELKRLLEIEAQEIVDDLVRDPIYLREPSAQDQEKVAVQRKMSHVSHQMGIYSDIQELNALLEQWGLSKCQIPNKLEQELNNTMQCIEKILKNGGVE